MKTKIIEVTNGFNWGKFLLGRFDGEWSRRSQICDALLPGSEPEPRPNMPMLSELGWARTHLWVLDLQTGEGALFSPGGHAPADLDRHSIWVCPLYEPFLTWLYTQELSDLDALPELVSLPDAPASLYGYRRSGGATS